MSSNTTKYSRMSLAALALAAALGIAALRVTTFSDIGGVRLSADWALIDFHQTIYYPVRAFIDGMNPYDRVAYLARYPEIEPFPPFLPSTLLIHLPFGVMPLALAETVYLAFTVVLIVLLGRAAVHAAGVTSWTPALVAATLVTLSRPGQWNLLLGQVTLQVVLLSWVAVRFAQPTPWLSGLALGLAAFKPTFAIPIGVLMLARGNVKAVVAGVVAALALNLPIVAILEHRAGALQLLAEDPTKPYHSWAGRSDSSPGTSFYRIDLVAMFARVTGRSVPHVEQAVIAMLVLGVAALLIRRIRVSETTPGHQTLSDAIIFMACLLCVHHLDYDLLLLAFPLAALVYRRMPGLLENPAVRRVMLWLFALMAANYVSTKSVLQRLTPDVSVRLALGSANTLALVLIFAMCGLTVLRLPSPRVAPALDDPSRGDGDSRNARSESVRAWDGG